MARVTKKKLIFTNYHNLLEENRRETNNKNTIIKTKISNTSNTIINILEIIDFIIYKSLILSRESKEDNEEDKNILVFLEILFECIKQIIELLSYDNYNIDDLNNNNKIDNKNKIDKIEYLKKCFIDDLNPVTFLNNSELEILLDSSDTDKIRGDLLEKSYKKYQNKLKEFIDKLIIEI